MNDVTEKINLSKENLLLLNYEIHQFLFNVTAFSSLTTNLGMTSLQLACLLTSSTKLANAALQPLGHD